MRFARIHKIATFLMVGFGLAALLLSGHLHPMSIWTVLVAFVGAWFIPQRWMHTGRWQTSWTVATVCAFLLCLLQIAVSGDFVMAAIYFLLFLVINKLYNRKKGRDHLQLYATSLMAVVAGAAINTNPSYLVCFVLHTIVSVWSLILFQLRREMEENYLLRHSDDASSERVQVERVLRSRRIVGWSFLGTTALGGLGVLLFSLLIFVFFPRIGLSQWGPITGKDDFMVGFSDRVQLGEHGLLRDNPRVVLRARFSPPQSRARLRTLRWKGMVFDRYREGGWSSRAVLPAPAVHQIGWRTIIGPSPQHTRGRRWLKQRLQRAVKTEILAMPGTGSVLPAPHPLLAVAYGRKSLEQYRTLHVSHGGVLQNPRVGRMVAYTTWSEPTPRNRLLRSVRKGLSPAAQQAYLHVPLALGRRFFALAAKLAANQKTARAKIKRALAYLSPQNGFTYTRRLKRVPRGHDPVVHFLFESQKGHCEYFASALALLLRAMGIPSRLVTGFLGGRWNPYGKYLSVRQGDAHAWVEAWLPESGWVVLEPTPPEGRRPHVGRGFWATLRLWLDNLRLRYLRWVLDYDAHSQWHLISSIRRWGRSNRALKTVFWALLGSLSAALLLLLLVWLAKQKKTSKHRTPGLDDKADSAPVIRQYRRLLAALTANGFSKKPEQTPREMARLWAEKKERGADAIIEATEIYYCARYDAKAATAQLLRLKNAVDHAIAALEIPPAKS